MNKYDRPKLEQKKSRKKIQGKKEKECHLVSEPILKLEKPIVIGIYYDEDYRKHPLKQYVGRQ
jgi:hypothetical protein